MEILICTDGSSSSILSAELVSKIMLPAINRIVVLGVSETESDRSKLNDSMDLMGQQLGGKYSLSRKIHQGNPIDEILAEALSFPYDLVVVGGGERHLGLLHSHLGSTTGSLARKLHTHFLVARNIPERIGKILFCIGAEAPTSETLTLGGAWIANTSAKIRLLHVVPSKKEAEDRTPKMDKGAPTSTQQKDGTSDLLLERASQQLRQAGVKAEIILSLRRGLVVDEVVDELSGGSYDLLVVGAHYQPGQDRWHGALLDDITDQLLNRSTCSVLII